MDIDDEKILDGSAATAFTMMFFAIIFFVDFRIGAAHVDLLPDLIGWMLIYIALAKIRGLAPSVQGMRTLALILMVLSVFDIVQFQIPIRESGSFSWWVTPTAPIGIIATVLEIVLIWRLCGLIIGIAGFTGDDPLARAADLRRRLYVAFIGGVAVLLLVSWFWPEVIPPFFVVGLLLAFIVIVLMMALMWRAREMCQRYRGLETASGPTAMAVGDV